MLSTLVAARLTAHPAVRCAASGDSPLTARCENIAKRNKTVRRYTLSTNFTVVIIQIDVANRSDCRAKSCVSINAFITMTTGEGYIARWTEETLKKAVEKLQNTKSGERVK